MTVPARHEEQSDVGRDLKLSIIVTSFNHARFVGSAITSALDVRWPRKEVIVVDDGSTDNSPEVIASFGDRIIAITKPNGGQNSAANVGFARATGDLVLFLDSDDLLQPSVGEEVAAVWTARTSKVQFGHIYVDHEGKSIGEVWPDYLLNPPLEPTLATLRRRGFYEAPTTSGNVWSRSFLEMVFPLPEASPSRLPGAYYGLFFDAYLNMLAPCFGEVVTLRTPQGCYRVHSANDSGSGKTLSPDFFLNRARDYARVVAKANEVLAALGKTPGFLIDCERDEMQMRYRLIARRMIPEVCGRESLARLFAMYCRSVLLGDFSTKHRLLCLCWALLTAGAPYPVARWAIDLRAAPALRPGFLHPFMRVRAGAKP